MPNPFARCMNVAGSQSAGAILFRLTYWLPKSKIKDASGRRWVSFSRERWMVEAALTEAQVKRGLAQLKQIGVINVQTKLVKGKKASFVTLTDYGQKCISAPEQVGQKCKIAPGAVQNCASQNLGNAPSIDTTYLSEGKGSEGNVVSSVTSHAGVYPGKTSGPGKVGSMIRLPPKAKRQGMNAEAAPSKPKSVHDVVAHVKANKMLHKPDSVSGLSFLWKNLLHEHHGLVATVTTKKELGLLKHFLNKCPPGTAEQAMTAAMLDWIKFAKTVEQQAGVKTSPSKPKLEFLLTHAGVAVNLIGSPSTSKPLNQEAGKGVGASRNLQSIAHNANTDPVDEVQDLDQLLSILGGD
ncbi:MAG: hypothetical protein M9945_14290 [Aquamicrobium sp.]|uniref:hypothetical protein n=1 Tax=Aquamicrobium sp. TaxID=1872579 RepID=UPI00349EB750|nr:hypothetical protein [Aquamicrobium sp.]